MLLTNWWRTRRARKALEQAEQAERDRAAIRERIAHRREKHEAFRPLYGELRRATNAALRAGVEAGRV